MKPILKVTDLTGGYDRNIPVIKDVSFEIYEQEIVALIGLNGAGKSTTIKHILGFMEPIAGESTINGKKINEDPDHYRSHFAYIPETPIYYKELTLWEHLELTAMVYGLDQKIFKQRVDPLLKEYRLEKHINNFPEHFSKGMRQKMMIMMSLLVQPSLFIIDEPLMGLDPLGIRSLLESLQNAKNHGSGILMSTHILSSAERYCDRFIIMHEGRIVGQGTLKELQQQSNQPNATLDDLYLYYIEGMVK